MTHTHTHTHARAHAQTHARTHTNTHPHTRTRIHTHTISLSQERALLRSDAYPAIYELCTNRGVAFCPIDPFLQLERPVYGRAEQEWQWSVTEPKDQNPAAFKDELAWSRDMLIRCVTLNPKP